MSPCSSHEEHGDFLIPIIFYQKNHDGFFDWSAVRDYGF